MANPFLSQVLGSVLGGRQGGAGLPGGMGGMGGMANSPGGGGLGDLLGGMLGGGAGGGLGLPGGAPAPGGLGRGGLGGNRSMLMMMLLPLVLQWVQRNGGIGSVLQRTRDQGYGRQAASWVSAGRNEALDSGAVHQLVGREELARMARETGVPEEEVSAGFAEILPEMVDHLSPGGDVPPDADDRIGGGLSQLAGALDRFR